MYKIEFSTQIYDIFQIAATLYAYDWRRSVQALGLGLLDSPRWLAPMERFGHGIRVGGLDGAEAAEHLAPGPATRRGLFDWPVRAARSLLGAVRGQD